MNVWGMTDEGNVRKQNQDSFYIDVIHESNQAICVVCDGMGGAKAGDVASQKAVEVFVDEIKKNLKPDMGKKYMKSITDHAVLRANEEVYKMSISEQQYNGMGTTMAGVVLSGQQAEVVNIGDSRVYLICEDTISIVTVDHSVVQDMLLRGDLTYSEARIHPNKNLITRALGTDEAVECDHFDITLRPGSYLLLCSDGLTDVVEDQELLFEVLHGGPISDCCRRLIEMAKQRGGPDNITVILISL